MAAIRQLDATDPNRIDLVVIPRKEKGTELDEEKALVLARIVTPGYDWDGEMKMSGFWSDVRRSMETNIKEFDDAELVQSGVEGAKQYIAVKESVWHADHDPAWKEVKQEPCYTNQNPKKFRVQVKDREGWWSVSPKNTSMPMKESQYILLTQALENQINNPDLKTDKPNGMLFIKQFAKNIEAFHAFVGKHVRWELRPSPLS